MAISNVKLQSGELIKMTITAFDDENYENTSLVGVFQVMYNPNTYTQEYVNSYEMVKTEGNQETLKFKGTESETMTFEFLFDATGTSVTGFSNMAEQILFEGRTDTAIDQFLDVTFKLQGETHQPRYLRLQWGSFIFEGRLEKATVVHKLFDTMGYPIRSTLNCVFRTHTSIEEQAKKAKKQSPDLTKQKLVREEDTLPLMSFDEYQNPAYYLELARVNRINNFRRLSPGMKLVLPPVSKTLVNG